MNTDLIAQLEKLSPTEGEWHVDRWDYIHINGKITFEPHGADSNDVTLASLAPTMRLAILDMAKEIEELKAENERLKSKRIGIIGNHISFAQHDKPNIQMLNDCARCKNKPKHKENIYCKYCLYEKKMSGY